MDDGYVRKIDAVYSIVGCTNIASEEELRKYVSYHDLEDHWSGGVLAALDAVEKTDCADAIPYSIDLDGTLIITVPKGTYEKFRRILVLEDGTLVGGLYYGD